MTPHAVPVRVFVVDDHPMVRAGLTAMIRSEAGFELAGEAGDGDEALSLLPGARADVVLMDLVMPRMAGLQAIAALKPQLPATRFVVLTSQVDPAEVRRAMAAGASGYLLKNASAQELVTVIRAAHAGQRVLAPEATDALIADTREHPPGPELTPRELELLILMTRGMNNQGICAALGIAMPTVKFHITNILAKLQVDNRTEAVLAAIKRKLVPPV